MNTNYHYDLLLKLIGWPDGWEIKSTTAFPPGCHSGNFECAVICVKIPSVDKLLFIQTNKDNKTINSNSVNTIAYIRKVTKKVKLENEKSRTHFNKVWNFDEKVRQLPFVHITRTSEIGAKTNLEEISFKDFTPEFESELIKFLKKFKKKIDGNKAIT